jgi:hypothetical protein
LQRCIEVIEHGGAIGVLHDRKSINRSGGLIALGIIDGTGCQPHL